jgi:hypothetical protein
MSDFAVTEIALINNGATQVGRAIKVANCDKLTISFQLTCSAGSLAGTLALTGTNDDARAIDATQTLPALTTGSAITALPATVTYASNAITFTTTGAGTYEVSVSFSSFPKWVRPVWTFGSGGGTITSQVTVAAWSSST